MTKTKLLLVEDDKNYAEAIQYVLEANNYEVSKATNKDEGLEKVKEVNPDLIILDVMMGRSADGILFSRKIRRTKEYAEYSRIPILVLTGMREQTGFFFPSEPKNPVFFPIDDLLEKPVKPPLLLQKVAELLGKKTAGAPAK
jgi:two-component system alkaline phosphatase synthesis response regulator PhoP